MSLIADRAGSTRLFQRPEAPGAQLQLIYFPGSVLFGRCTLANLGNLARPFGEKAFLVTYGQGRTSKAGVAQRVKESLASAGIESVVYEIKGSPLLDTIDEGAVQLRASGAAFVVGAGGGSVLDSAKAIAALAANEGKWEDYQLGRRVLTALPVPTCLFAKAPVAPAVSRVTLSLPRMPANDALPVSMVAAAVPS